MSRGNETTTSGAAGTSTTIYVQNMYAGNLHTGAGGNTMGNAGQRDVKPFTSDEQEKKIKKRKLSKKKYPRKNSKSKPVYSIPKDTKELLSLLEKCQEEIDSNHVDEAVKIWEVFQSLNLINDKEEYGEDEEKCLEMGTNLVKKFSKTKFSEIAFELNFWRAQLIKKFIRKPNDLLHKLVSISFQMYDTIKPMKFQDIENLNMTIYFQRLDEILKDIYRIDIDKKWMTIQIAWYLTQYGLICSKAKLHTKAIEIHKKGITLMEFGCIDEAEHFKVFALCHSNAAGALEEQGSFKEVKHYYETALKCYEKAKDMDKNEREKKIKAITNSIQKIQKKTDSTSK